MSEVSESKEQILESYDNLVRDRRVLQQRVSLKGDEAQQVKDRETARKAALYTVDSIVKGLADLQLDFGRKIESLAVEIKAESDKVGQLKRAIEVETRNLSELKNVKLAANATLIRDQEMAQRAKEAQARIDEKLKAFEEEVSKQREAWTREQEEYEAALAEYASRQEKDRSQEKEEHEYARERQAKLEADGYTQKKRDLERELADRRARSEKDWAAREAALSLKSAEHAENLVKIEAFPTELEKAVNDAREDAIKKTLADAKIDAELSEKEIAASTQVFELKIESLEKVIAEQTEQIQLLMERLKVALDRSQNLAVKAIEKTSTSKNRSED